MVYRNYFFQPLNWKNNSLQVIENDKSHRKEQHANYKRVCFSQFIDDYFHET